MVQVELKPLLGRLNRPCARALENAAGLCVSRCQNEVAREHLLLALLEDPVTDLGRILARFDVEQSAISRVLGLRRTPSGKPAELPAKLSAAAIPPRTTIGVDPRGELTVALGEESR